MPALHAKTPPLVVANTRHSPRYGCVCAPSMGAILEVQVLRRAGHSEASEVQLRKGDRAWRGSMERKP